MLSKIIRDILILIAIFSLGWYAFYIIDPFPDEIDFALSVEMEEKLGKLVVEELILRDKSKQVQNDFIDSNIALIQNRLENALDDSKYNYKIILVKSQMVNAMTLPGGYIIVYTGLLMEVKSAEELAAVLSHEIGHAELRHVVVRLIKEIGLTILLGGDDNVISETVNVLTSKAFDREQEENADEFALKLMEKASIDPVALANFFETMDNLSGGLSIELLSTHPNTKSRIKTAKKYSVSTTFEKVKFGIDWENLIYVLNKGGFFEK